MMSFLRIMRPNEARGRRFDKCVSAIARTGEGSGLRPETRQGLCPLDPQQRARPFAIYQLGFVLKGGPTRTLRGRGWPSPENKPINGFQGPLPLAGIQGAEPLGGVSGRSPVRRPRGRLRQALDATAIPTWSGPRVAAASADSLRFVLAPGRLPIGRRVYAIGDIHGCLAQLQQLHQEIVRDLAARPVAAPLLVHL